MSLSSFSGLKEEVHDCLLRSRRLKRFLSFMGDGDEEKLSGLVEEEDVLIFMRATVFDFRSRKCLLPLVKVSL